MQDPELHNKKRSRIFNVRKIRILHVWPDVLNHICVVFPGIRESPSLDSTTTGVSRDVINEIPD